MMKRQKMILILIYWQISIGKYIPKHPISLFSNFSSLLLNNLKKKTILKIITPEWTVNWGI